MNLSILGYWAKLAQGPGFTACHKQLVCIARSVRKELIHVPSQALWGSVYSTVLYRTIGLSVQQDPCVLIKSKNRTLDLHTINDVISGFLASKFILEVGFN
jgi:hypothetical protein